MADIDHQARRVWNSRAEPTQSSTGCRCPRPSGAGSRNTASGAIGCVNTTISVWENASETLALLGKWRQVIAASSDLVALATSVEEIEAIRKSGRTAIVFGFQNTAPVEHNIDLFGAFRDLGVCIMQLTYNLQNYIGCGYWEENDSGVSSRFGRKRHRGDEPRSAS